MNAPTKPATTAAASDASAEAFRLAEALTVLTAGALQPAKVGDAHFVNLPPGYTQTDITKLVEAAAPRPTRKRGVVELAAVESLIQYCKDQGAAATAYLFADPDALAIAAVFNDQRDLPGWRDHRAVFKAAYTPEFQRWIGRNGHTKAMSQTEFAEFIEDNLADITEPAAHQLLEVATTIQAKTDINFASAKRLQDGQVQMQYTEAINATAGANGALTIPREFQLGLRIFKNGDGYKLRARLKYRIGSGSVKFWYELDRPERAVEDAFSGYINQVAEQTGYTVLLGKA